MFMYLLAKANIDFYAINVVEEYFFKKVSYNDEHEANKVSNSDRIIE